jgi:small subunit ribosomal protein S3Ae
MTDIIQKEASTNNLTDFVKYLLTDAPAEAITKACTFVYPLNNVVVRKVKMLKKPKLDITKLNDLFKENITTEAKPKKGAKNTPVVVDESQNLLSK